MLGIKSERRFVQRELRDVLLLTLDMKKKWGELESFGPQPSPPVPEFREINRGYIVLLWKPLQQDYDIYHGIHDMFSECHIYFKNLVFMKKEII